MSSDKYIAPRGRIRKAWYHTNDLCDEDFNSLAIKITNLFKRYDFEKAEEQIEKCIKARKKTQNNYKKRGRNNNTHSYAIRKLEDLLRKIIFINSNLHVFLFYLNSISIKYDIVYNNDYKKFIIDYSQLNFIYLAMILEKSFQENFNIALEELYYCMKQYYENNIPKYKILKELYHKIRIIKNKNIEITYDIKNKRFTIS
jgi:hypothetical protein